MLEDGRRYRLVEETELGHLKVGLSMLSWVILAGHLSDEDYDGFLESLLDVFDQEDVEGLASMFVKEHPLVHDYVVIEEVEE